MGRHVATELLRAGYRVFAPIRKQSIQKAEPLKIHKNLILLEGDFYDLKRLETLQSEKIEAILHFASIRGAGNGSAADYEKINVTGTQILLDFARQNKTPNFLYCSSVGVLGTIPRDQPAGRLQKAVPDNSYHQTKWQAEELVRKFSQRHINTIILRPTITYGNGDDGFIPRLIGLVKNKRFPLSSAPFSIHLLHVQALAALVLKIVQDNLFNNQTYIAADREALLFSELVKQISRETNGGYYRVPSAVFKSGRAMLRLPGLQGLRTSLELISRSWTYDIQETIRDLGYIPDDTAVSISQYIKEYV